MNSPKVSIESIGDKVNYHKIWMMARVDGFYQIVQNYIKKVRVLRGCCKPTRHSWTSYCRHFANYVTIFQLKYSFVFRFYFVKLNPRIIFNKINLDAESKPLSYVKYKEISWLKCVRYWWKYVESDWFNSRVKLLQHRTATLNLSEKWQLKKNIIKQVY